MRLLLFEPGQYGIIDNQSLFSCRRTMQLFSFFKTFSETICQSAFHSIHYCQEVCE